MTTAIETSLMTAGQVAESGRVLGRAFYDDPMFQYIIPDDAARGPAMEWFMGRGALYGHKYGEVYTTGATVEGDAVWLPPGETNLPMLRMAQAGMLIAPFKLGFSPFRRFLGVMNTFEALHHRDMPERHWYLMILGVEPARQGQGIGGALIAPIVARADAEGLPCYLETAKARNVAFYTRHGFEVIVEDDIRDGFHYWTMKRMPRA